MFDTTVFMDYANSTMKKKPMTIEQLARMVKRGFDDITIRMATKEELHDLRKDMIEGFDRVNADVRDIKIALGPMVRFVAEHDVKLQHLQNRVDRLERKVGIGR